MDMMKSVCVIAILAAAVSTSAVAKDLKQDQKTTAPVTSAKQMNDADLDKVTAGAAANPDPGIGRDTAASVGADLGQSGIHVPYGKGLGTDTTPGRPGL